jgi:hypothetical protein
MHVSFQDWQHYLRNELRNDATNRTGAVCDEAAAAARLLNRWPENRRKPEAANSKQPGRRIHLQRAALIQVVAWHARTPYIFTLEGDCTVHHWRRP